MQKKESSSLKNLTAYLSHYKFRATLACGSSVLNKILDLMPPLLVGWVIDSVKGVPPQWIKAVTNTSDPIHLALFLAILGFVIFGLESVFQWAYQFLFLSLAQDIQHDIRMDTYSHIQNKKIEFFENHRLGESMAIVNDDINQLERFLNTGFNKLLQMGIMLIFSIVVLMSTSWQLALICLTPIPFVIWGSLYYQQKISPKYQKVRECVGKLSSQLENNLSGILVIKSFTAESFEYKRIQKASNDYKNANFEAIKLSTVYVPLIRMVIAFGFSGVLFIGSYWVLKNTGILTIGQLVLFSMLIQRMLWPLTELGTILDDYERANASCKRVFSLLHSPIEKTNKETKALPKIEGKIELKNLSFSYENNIPILKNLNCTLNAHESIGIAGTTGSGKSTLIKLLLNLYHAKEGQITIDNIDIQSIPLKQLRQNIALVSQDVYLFHGTLYENIAYGYTEETDTETLKKAVINAAKEAELDTFVNTLPEGYQTLVGEKGIKLSGGQRQRLSIARALLKNAPIMILDEATSSVDTETERAIQKNLSKLTQGKTAIIIAHRLSTIRHTHRILVLTQGKIEEEGSHEELLSRGGIYADLWNIQIGNA